jgi:hypothetical protein
MNLPPQSKREDPAIVYVLVAKAKHCLDIKVIKILRQNTMNFFLNMQIFFSEIWWKIVKFDVQHGGGLQTGACIARLPL